MPLGGALTSALVTSAATTGGSLLASKFFGGGKSGGSGTGGASSFAGINAGGLTSSFNGGNIGVSSSAGRSGLVGSISQTFPQQASEIAKLRASVAPGVSGLRSSRLAEIDNAKRAAIGNLRENLQRRRVLGSSFGNDAITRAEAEFGQQKERVAAESYLQELELTHALIGEEFNVRRGEFQTQLDELNIQADVATKLATQLTGQLGENARFKAELAAKEAQAASAFFGQTFQPVFDELGRSIAGINSGSGSKVVSQNSSISRAA